MMRLRFRSDHRVLFRKQNHDALLYMSEPRRLLNTLSAVGRRTAAVMIVKVG
jgi:hypothetical protein